jgi:hypothetical protein
MDHGPKAAPTSSCRLLLAPVVGLVLLAGCQTAGRHNPDDVLFGGTPSVPPPPIPAGGKPLTATAAGPGAGAAPLSPLPPPGPSSSLASLTTGGNTTPENDRSSRAPAVTPVPDNGAWRGSATLHGPQPADDPGARITTVGATGTGPMPAGGGSSDAYQQVMDKLKARGMTWMRLETTSEAGSWKFSCTVADRANPGIEQRYEASAPGDGGLAAMRAVLDKIDHPEP